MLQAFKAFPIAGVFGERRSITEKLVGGRVCIDFTRIWSPNSARDGEKDRAARLLENPSLEISPWRGYSLTTWEDILGSSVDQS
jgi:hypothetical protein